MLRAYCTTYLSHNSNTPNAKLIFQRLEQCVQSRQPPLVFAERESSSNWGIKILRSIILVTHVASNLQSFTIIKENSFFSILAFHPQLRTRNIYYFHKHNQQLRNLVFFSYLQAIRSQSFIVIR